MVADDLKLELEPGVLNVITIAFTVYIDNEAKPIRESHQLRCHHYTWNDGTLVFYRVIEGELREFACFGSILFFQRIDG